MRSLLQEIKYNREYSLIDKIIKSCTILGHKSTTRYYRIEIEVTRGRSWDTLVYIRTNGHYLVKRDMFIKYGMSELITEAELAKYFYEKFIKPDKTQ